MGANVIARLLAKCSSKNPVYVFHHIPKCGGTSILEVLDQWFLTVKDYRSGWTMNYPKKVNVDRLRSKHCLCGHFELEGYYLHQRYPEVVEQDRFRVFTFVRDPLQVKLSLRRDEHLRKPGARDHPVGVQEHLFDRPNYIAERFPATVENYKEVIDRYFFVGILEDVGASVDTLAQLIGKAKQSVPHANVTQEKKQGPKIQEVSDDVASRFREENALDYLIYDYCVAKFNATASALEAAGPSS